MADVEILLSEYIAEHRSGGDADPVEYLDQVEGTDRAELAELIDGYLARSPGQAWDPEAFRGSPAERLAEQLGASFQGHSGLWPVVLRRLRDRAQLTRDVVVERMTETLGVGGQEEQVGEYLHEMEHGLLPSRGVSQRALDALGGVLGTSGEFLRRIGEPFSEGGGPAEGPVFARIAMADEALPATPQSPGATSPGMPSREGDRGREVDELFTGG